MPRPQRPHTKWQFSVFFGALGAIIVGIVVLAFLWPSATATARDLPVAITGPMSQVSATKAAADAKAADLIDFTTVANRAAAVASIERRETYGAVVLGRAPEVLVASAGSSTATQLLRNLALQLQAGYDDRAVTSGGQPVTVAVKDVVPLSEDDPNGAGLAASSFPLALGGMLGGILISLLVVGIARRLVALLVNGAGAGLIVGLILQPLLGVLQGPFLLNAAGLGLAMLGTASLIVGFTALLGPRGVALGAVITVLIGNPIAGATMPYQFIAGPWGAVGQFFVPGAASTLVRELSYFPSASSTQQWLVLSGWAVLGLVFSVTGHFRYGGPIPLPASELEPEPEPESVPM